MKYFTVLTLFPDLFTSVISQSIIARAIKNGHISIDFVNFRDFATDSYKTVDGHPYGGGVGMVLKVDIADTAIQYAKSLHTEKRPFVILLDPHGKPFKQKDARVLGDDRHIIFVCPRYEGVDERIRTLVDEEYSIGDYIVTGGELPAMVIIDSVARLIPGVLGKEQSAVNESFTNPNMLEEPHYTSPQVYKGMVVPDVLLSGNHKTIEEWRKDASLEKTKTNRPDLIDTHEKSTE